MRGVARAAAGAYDRESCWMDSIVRTCHTKAVAAAWVPGGGDAYAACRYGWAAAAPLQPSANGWLLAIVRAALGGRQRTERR